MNRLERFGHAVSASLLKVATAMLLLIVAINALNVTGRYVFGHAFGWSEEAMQFLMIGCVFLAFVEVTYQRDHIRMDMVVRLLPQLAQRVLSIISNLVLLGCCALIVVAGVPVVWKLYEFGQTSDAAELPVFIPQLFVPFGLAAAGLLLLLRLRSWGKDFDAAAPETATEEH